MNKKKLKDGLYMLSMNVDDMLFESMWELPHGVSMNSYLVKGEKTAIIDGVIGWDGVPETLYKELGDIDVDPKNIAYLIVNHLEPDHSGWIDNFKKVNDDFTVVTTAKGEPILKAFYGEDLKIMVVGEGDTLDLGNGKVLSFHPTPNVHWPETMLTYEQCTKALFSCDMYGAFGTVSDRCFYDELSKEEQAVIEEETIRYYSNVLTTFSPMVKRSIAKTKELDVEMILTGHGPAYRGDINQIIAQYESYTNYANGFGKNEVAILYGSMYGTTEKVVHIVKDLIEEKGLKVHMLHMPYTSESEMVAKVFSSAGVIVAASTYEYKMFPPVAHAIDELGRKKITGKESMFFGSYGWNSGAQKDFTTILDTYRMKWNIDHTLEFEGIAKEVQISEIKEAVNDLLKRMKEKVL
ncbi:MAG: FprA family A-type flavoprotein [Candidatus Izemoplasmataceae bacterium]